MKWILLAFVAECIVVSCCGCMHGRQELIHTARTEHTEYWHDINKSHSKVMLELQYKYTF